MRRARNWMGVALACFAVAASFAWASGLGGGGLGGSGGFFGVYTGNFTITGDIYPTANNTYDLGTNSLLWKNGYFNGSVQIGTLTASGGGTKLTVGNGTATTLVGNVADGAAAVSLILNAGTVLANAGAHIIDFQNNAVTKFFLDLYGQPTMGVGSGTATAKVGGTLNADSTGVGNVGASAPDDLQSYTIPANALIQANRGIRVRCYGTTANNANAKSVRMLFGGTTVITKALTISIAGFWEMEATVLRTGTSGQDIFGKAVNYGGTTVSSTDGATVTNLATFATATETETAQIVAKCVSTASTSDNDIISQGLLVDFL